MPTAEAAARYVNVSAKSHACCLECRADVKEHLLGRRTSEKACPTMCKPVQHTGASPNNMPVVLAINPGENADAYRRVSQHIAETARWGIEQLDMCKAMTDKQRNYSRLACGRP